MCQSVSYAYPMVKSRALSQQSGSKESGSKPLAYQADPLFYHEILSFSTTLLPHIGNNFIKGEVVGIFRRAVNVLVEDGLVALVLPELGNGPFHIVVNALPQLSPGQSIKYRWNGEQLIVGDWAFLITPTTQHWDPRPQWELLEITPEKAGLLQDIVMQMYEKNPHDSTHSITDIQKILTASRLDNFWQCLRDGNYCGFIDAARGLVGLGPGLTPTGDDFLAGFMLSLWALHFPNTKKVCGWIVAAAQRRTTHISIAYLKAIAAGYADERWHQFLHAFNNYNKQLLFSAISHILDFGATSGSDMLFGFMSGAEFQHSFSSPNIEQ